MTLLNRRGVGGADVGVAAAGSHRYGGGWQGQERSGWPCEHGETMGIIRTHPGQGHPVGLTLPPAAD